MGNTMFENLDIWRPDDDYFIITIRDREVKNGEKWVVAALTNDEGKQLYEYLKSHFSEES